MGEGTKMKSNRCAYTGEKKADKQHLEKYKDGGGAGVLGDGSRVMVQ